MKNFVFHLRSKFMLICIFLSVLFSSNVWSMQAARSNEKGANELSFIQMIDSGWSYDNGVLKTKGGSIALNQSLQPPYTITFQAQMPRVKAGEPDFGIPQVWFSADYAGQHDRLSFAVRGGPIQCVNIYDFKGFIPPIEKRGGWRAPANSAYEHYFWRLPDEIEQGQWFTVKLLVKKNITVLTINGEQVLTYERQMHPESSFTFGDSWQHNKFKSLELDAVVDPELSLILDKFRLPIRENYASDAVKIDFGPSNLKPADGWQRIGAIQISDFDVPGWKNKTAGARNRNIKNTKQRLNTLIALAHEHSQSNFSLPLSAGRYVISIGVGDPRYTTYNKVQAPDGNSYLAELSAGDHAEIRFEIDHKGGPLLIPMSGDKNAGMSLNYIVAEPFKQAESVKLSTPDQQSLSLRQLKAKENKRKSQRAAYKSAKLPKLNEGNVLEKSISGEWLFTPADISLEEAISPKVEDMSWHILQVPSFWNEIGWWIYGQGNRHVSQRFIVEELERTEQFTFEHEDLRTAFYRHWLNVPADWEGQEVILEFDAVASVCVVYINGQKAGTNRGMFKPFAVDISEYIRPGEKNLLAMWVNSGLPEDKQEEQKDDDESVVAVTMVVEKDMVEGLPRGIYSKPAGEAGKYLNQRQGGIWQDVRIKVSKNVSLSDVWVRAALDNLKLDLEVSGSKKHFENLEVKVEVADSSETIIDTLLPWKSEDSDGINKMSLDFKNLSPEFWSPGNPHLYELKLSLLSPQGEVLDQQIKKVGFRTFTVKGNQFYLNGKPFRWLGSNMGPFGLKPNDRELAKKFTNLMKDGNQNATRSVCSPYPKVWLEESDKQGVAVSFEGTWSWLMISEMPIPEEQSLNAWKEEWFALIKEHRNHPSIVMWTINNEAYITHDKNLERRAEKWNIIQEVVKEMRELDPTRPIVLWSGYSRKRIAGSVQAISDKIVSKDDGDVDDIHVYAGTYERSWFGNPGLWENFYKGYMLPDRPMVSQEAATAYPNTDTGHQESSYIASWHGHIWMGEGIYEYQNPMPFLKRHAWITKEQLEIVRRLDVAGWLAFCNGTWYNQVHVSDEITPYPVHEAAKIGLSPVLVSMEMRQRNFFAGQQINPIIFLRNDDIKQRDFKYVDIELQLKNSAGDVLDKMQTKMHDVKLASLRKESFELKLPDKLPNERSTYIIELEAVSPYGEKLCKNNYELTVCSLEYVQSQRKPSVYVTGLNNKSPVLSLLEKAGIQVKIGAPDDSKDIWLAWSPESSEQNIIVEFSNSGGIVIVQHPNDVSFISALKDATLNSKTFQGPREFPSSNGEVANVVNFRRSPLLNEMRPTDIAWWAASDHNSPTVYDRALIFKDALPDNIEVLVNHIPPHGYDNNWQVEFPLVMTGTGKGKIFVSTLNFDRSPNDPLAAKFLINLLDLIDSKDLVD